MAYSAVIAYSSEVPSTKITEIASARRNPTEIDPCATAGTDRMELWLVDSIGRAVRPSVPRDDCGRPTAAVQRALDALAITDQVDAPVSLLSPATPAPTAATG